MIWRLKKDRTRAAETTPFDPADYLDDPETRAAFLASAMDSGDPDYIADAEAVVARAAQKFR